MIFNIKLVIIIAKLIKKKVLADLLFLVSFLTRNSKSLNILFLGNMMIYLIFCLKRTGINHLTKLISLYQNAVFYCNWFYVGDTCCDIL